jgi:AraC family transcriptional regulator, regulatory protein of adaptative response / DNA-3-methyladenine glycosylase II
MESRQSPEVRGRRPAEAATRYAFPGPARFAPEAALDSKVCWQALRSRDHRFDGRFFPGVVTTGVYCRTICPVPLRKPENIQWFPTAAAAEAAGFRPCRRCNPQTSPGTPAWFGTAAVVTRGLKLVLDGGLDRDNVDAFAERVGIGPRQLRRLFVQHLGTSPLKVAHIRRLQLAQTLIESTNLPIAEIALRSGFRSVRQFNQVMQIAFDQAPSQLRRLGGAAEPGPNGGIEVRLAYRGPLDWPALAEFLAPRATPGAEKVEPHRYRRTIEVEGDIGEIEVRPEDHRPRLRVRVRLKRYAHLVRVVERVRRLFDLFADPIRISTYLSGDSRLKGLIELRPGLRIPGAWDGFELAVKVLLGEGLTAPASIEQVARLVRAFGRPARSGTELGWLFPPAEVLAWADLSQASIRKEAGEAIRSLAQAICHKQISFDAPHRLNEVVHHLLSIPGIDVSKAQYIVMRSFGEPDAFPLSDRQLLLALARLGKPDCLGHELSMTESWRPWRAYAAVHLLTALAKTNWEYV